MPSNNIEHAELQGTPHSFRVLVRLPKHALTRSRRRTAAQITSQAVALGQVALAMTRSRPRSTTPPVSLPLPAASGQLFPASQKPSMFPSLR